MSRLIRKTRRSRRVSLEIPLSLIRAIILFGREPEDGPRGGVIHMIVEYMDSRFHEELQYFTTRSPFLDDNRSRSITVASSAYPAISTDAIYLWGHNAGMRTTTASMGIRGRNCTVESMLNTFIEALGQWKEAKSPWNSRPLIDKTRLPRLLTEPPDCIYPTTWRRYVFASGMEVVSETCERDTPSTIRISLH